MKPGNVPQKVTQAVVAACPHHGLEVFKGGSSSMGPHAAPSVAEGTPLEDSDVRHFYNEVWLPRMREHLTLLQQQQGGTDPDQEQPLQSDPGAHGKGNPNKVRKWVSTPLPACCADLHNRPCASMCMRAGASTWCHWHKVAVCRAGIAPPAALSVSQGHEHAAGGQQQDQHHALIRWVLVNERNTAEICIILLA